MKPTVQASVREHADLVNHVGPVTGGAEVLEGIKDDLPHLVDAAAHLFEVVEPFLAQLGLGKNQVHDASTVAGAVGDHGAGEPLQLGLNGVLGLRRRSNGNQAARTLAWNLFVERLAKYPSMTMRA